MKKITAKKKFFSASIAIKLFIIGIILMFLGVILSSVAIPLDSSTMLSIALITVCIGIGVMILVALSQNEGIFGFIFGLMITISITAFMLMPFIGILPWLPLELQSIIPLIATPLILASGGGTGAVHIFVIFI